MAISIRNIPDIVGIVMDRVSLVSPVILTSASGAIIGKHSVPSDPTSTNVENLIAGGVLLANTNTFRDGQLDLQLFGSLFTDDEGGESAGFKAFEGTVANV